MTKESRQSRNQLGGAKANLLSLQKSMGDALLSHEKTNSQSTTFQRKGIEEMMDQMEQIYKQASSEDGPGERVAASATVSQEYETAGGVTKF